MLLKSCAICGKPSEQSRCETHRPRRRTPSATARGYDAAWTRLSVRARQLQPWCTECGATENLSVDHSQLAWSKVEAGQRLTLKDFADGTLKVLCPRCQSAAGNARGINITHV